MINQTDVNFDEIITNKDKMNDWFDAVKNGDIDVNALSNVERPMSYFAIKYDNSIVLDELFKLGTNHNVGTGTLFAFYARTLHTDHKILKLLLKNKIEVRGTDRMSFVQLLLGNDRSGIEATNIVKELLKKDKGFVNEIRKNGYSPLFVCKMKNRPKLAVLLMDNGADPFDEDVQETLAQDGSKTAKAIKNWINNKKIGKYADLLR